MNAPNRTATTKSSTSAGNGGQVLREAVETGSNAEQAGMGTDDGRNR